LSRRRRDASVHVSGALKILAVSLVKIANDLRWLAAGPRCAIGEIGLPDTQPGSSIMPGKVNPLPCESVIQVAVHVIGCDATITLCAQAGFELNVTMPIVTLKLLEAIEFSAAVINVSVGIEVNEARSRELVEKSLPMITASAPLIGYDAAAVLRMKQLQAARRSEKWRSQKSCLRQSNSTKLWILGA
jgi:fumarate hydratase, class II